MLFYQLLNFFFWLISDACSYHFAAEKSETLKVGKVNIDEEPALATQFGIASIPMLVLFKNGKVVRTSVGYQPKEEILKLIE